MPINFNVIRFTDRCGEFLFPEGRFAVFHWVVRLLCVTLLFWGLAIFAMGQITKYVDAAAVKVELRKEGIAPDSVFIIPIDGAPIEGNNNLLKRNVALKAIKAAALREFIAEKIAQCRVQAPQKSVAYIDVAGGRYDCVITTK